jgi:hypothetical protein
MRPGSVLLELLTGTQHIRWMNVEQPRVTNKRRDLLGERPNGDLVGVEIQTENQTNFGFRIGEYQYSVANRFGRMPRQIIPFIGPDRLTMPGEIEGPDYYLRFHIVDIRNLDGERLLASPNLGDNVAAVLTSLGQQAGLVRRVVAKIAGGPLDQRGAALAELALLASLRKLSDEVQQEAKDMLSERDILENAIFGPPYREGKEHGLAEGLAKGVARGRVEGQLDLLVRMLERRFGKVTARDRKRFAAMDGEQLTEVALRVGEAASIKDLLSR